MSFRKRNVALSSGAPRETDGSLSPSSKPVPVLPGLRPSPLDGRATTSTGTITLDGLLAGHAGLPVGTSVLIEENGTTDYAGALLRYYAAEGLVQGHQVHVLGVLEQWGRELPGLVGNNEKEKRDSNVSEKLKIAWRYERLVQPGIGTSSREPARDRSTGADSSGPPSDMPAAFCHTFDLTKRLVHPASSVMTFVRIDSGNPEKSPYTSALGRLEFALSSSPTNSVHRLVIPSLLSPALYPPHASSPEHILQFLQGLRALLSTYAGRLTVMLTLPLSLYPRSSGLVRWMELLSDGVVELSPFPHSYQPETSSTTSGTAASQDEPPQGLLKIHRLPILHERGGGTPSVGEDWAFTLSRRKFTIKPFSLPPIEGDTDAQQAAGSEQKGKKADMDF